MRLLIIATLLLCGCALTPADIRDKGLQSTFTSTQAPAQAAQCIARNAENMDQQARMHTLPDGAIETLIYITYNGTLNSTAMTEMRTATTGSVGVLWVNPNVLQRDRLLVGLLKGC